MVNREPGNGVCRLSNVSSPSLQYIAGFCDGEACFRWNAPGGAKPGIGSPRVEISNTYLPILETIKSMFGGTVRKAYETNGNQRTCYHWYIDGSDCRDFIRLVLPYLIEKQEQAQLLLTAFGTHRIHRKELLDKVRALKRIDNTGGGRYEST